MTIWKPAIAEREGPRYVAIADAIAQDVTAGVLPEGAKLPTHRDLAERLGVTVGTVTRGYAEAERRGLTVGEVGRGTFVRSRRDPEDFGWRDAAREGVGKGVVDMSGRRLVGNSNAACGCDRRGLDRRRGSRGCLCMRRGNGR